MQPPTPIQPLTKTDVREILRVSERTIENWVRRGEMPAPKRIGGRRVYWSSDEFFQWLNSRLGSAEAKSRRPHGRPGKAVEA